MFTELINILDENGKGIHGFQKFAGKARQRARDDSERAAAWVLLGGIAGEFAERNERAAITTAQTGELADMLTASVERLNAAYADADPAARLAALNATAQVLINAAD